MLRKDLNQSIDLWIGSMRQWDAEEIALGNVTDAERLEAQRYRFAALRERALIGKALLRNILAKYVGASPLELQFARGEKGKPYLPQYPDLQFNLSHSKDMFLCGVTCGVNIGVDIEAIDEKRDNVAVAERFFTQQERALLEGMEDAACIAAFFRCWTRKEALIKGTGKGLSLDLQSFDVTADQVAFLAAAGVDEKVHPGWKVQSFPAGSGYSAAVAYCGEISRLNFLPLNRETLQTGLLWKE